MFNLFNQTKFLPTSTAIVVDLCDERGRDLSPRMVFIDSGQRHFTKHNSNINEITKIKVRQGSRMFNMFTRETLESLADRINKKQVI